MRAYLIGLYPGIWEVVCNGFDPPVDPKNPTPTELGIIHLNGEATSVLFSSMDGDENNRVMVLMLPSKYGTLCTMRMKELTN
jgi:hypothetical protein